MGGLIMKGVQIMNREMHTSLVAAVALALVVAMATALPVAAAPPGYGGPGGGVLVKLPYEQLEFLSGNAYNSHGPLANARVELWEDSNGDRIFGNDGDTPLARTRTDKSGDYELDCPPGYGGPGGSLGLIIRLPRETWVTSGYITGDGEPLEGLTVEWWKKDVLLDSTTTGEGGDYYLAPPAYGGGGDRSDSSNGWAGR